MTMIQRIKAVAFALSLCLLSSLNGCSSAPTAADYAKEQPVLSLQRYFNGPLTAHGLFTDRSGRVVKRFTVQMNGRWDGAQGCSKKTFSTATARVNVVSGA